MQTDNTTPIIVVVRYEKIC